MFQSLFQAREINEVAKFLLSLRFPLELYFGC